MLVMTPQNQNLVLLMGKFNRNDRIIRQHVVQPLMSYFSFSKTADGSVSNHSLCQYTGSDGLTSQHEKTFCLSAQLCTSN